MDNLNQYQSYEDQQFPAFPVVFQPQIEQKQLSRIRTANGTTDKSVFRKYPQKQLNSLKQMLFQTNNLLSSPDLSNKYHFLWTDELNRLKLQDFISDIYTPLNEQFIMELKANLAKIKITRLGAHKVLIGKIQQNKCQGKSIILFKNGSIYEGEMHQNKRHGKGCYLDPNLGYYKGFFKNDIKQGEGLQILKNKTIYKGHFVNGLRHGANGYYADVNENQYFGEWKLGIMHGKGYYKTKSSIYYGVFVNWLKHGQGEQRFIQGDTYKGDYQNGRFDGFGTYRWVNSSLYQGSFKNGFRHGKGKWTDNETKYLGNYVQGIKEGYGELYFPSGNFYKGNFVNDKRQAYGEMFWTDGSFYKGQWKNGIQNGKGQIYLVGGQIVSGIFQNSILVQTVPAPFERQHGSHENQNFEHISSEPRGIVMAKNRTYSESKGFNYKKRLSKIDETVRKPQYSITKAKMYFKSPERSQGSYSKGKDHVGHHQGHGHSHGHGHGRECKCVKRLQNFRLKQQVKTKLNDSRFNNINV